MNKHKFLITIYRFEKGAKAISQPAYILPWLASLAAVQNPTSRHYTTFRSVEPLGGRRLAPVGWFG
jgi:hypothetical protein